MSWFVNMCYLIVVTSIHYCFFHCMMGYKLCLLPPTLPLCYPHITKVSRFLILKNWTHTTVKLLDDNELEMVWWWPHWKYYPRIFLKRLRKTSQSGQPSGLEQVTEIVGFNKLSSTPHFLINYVNLLKCIICIHIQNTSADEHVCYSSLRARIWHPSAERHLLFIRQKLLLKERKPIHSNLTRHPNRTCHIFAKLSFYMRNQQHIS